MPVLCDEYVNLQILSGIRQIVAEMTQFHEPNCIRSRPVFVPFFSFASKLASSPCAKRGIATGSVHLNKPIKYRLLWPLFTTILSSVSDFPFRASLIPTRILLQEDDSLSDRESMDGEEESLQSSGMIKGPWQKSVRSRPESFSEPPVPPRLNFQVQPANLVFINSETSKFSPVASKIHLLATSCFSRPGCRSCESLSSPHVARTAFSPLLFYAVRVNTFNPNIRSRMDHAGGPVQSLTWPAPVALSWLNAHPWPIRFIF
jgi:hypothetical protein